MPDKENEIQELGPEDEESQPEKKSKGSLLFIVLAVGVFVIATGVFSVTMGVFSSNPTAETETIPDSLAEDSAEIDSVAAEQKALEALEREIFGDGKAVDAETIDDLAEKTAVEESNDDKPDFDSIATANWVKTEKAKLAKERAEIEKLRKELEAREVHLEKLLARAGKVEKDRIADLAKLYEGMKPEQVVPLLIKLTDDQAVEVLLNMKTSHAAKILGAINPDRAARISNNMINLTKEN